MRPGIVLLNFGEPEAAEPAGVVRYLERIFLANADLDPGGDPEAVRRRARLMAERRAPGLVADYRAIGGSPQNEQAEAQARRLESLLRDAGQDARVVCGFQFTEPSIPEAVERLRAGGADRLVGLPVYPLCGPSTTVAALDSLRRAVRASGWDAPVVEVSGWHGDPAYVRLWARHILAHGDRAGVDVAGPATRLVFSAHGTPLRYLERGSRYDEYVREHCRRIAAEVGVARYLLGYQNHANRPGLEWTGPDIDRVLEEAAATRIVVVPVSFMQEQSETLAELDRALRATAEGLGLEFHRVPIPHDHPAFDRLLAQLVARALAGDVAPDGLAACRCRTGALCRTG